MLQQRLPLSEQLTSRWTLSVRLHRCIDFLLGLQFLPAPLDHEAIPDYHDRPVDLPWTTARHIHKTVLNHNTWNHTELNITQIAGRLASAYLGEPCYHARLARVSVRKRCYRHCRSIQCRRLSRFSDCSSDLPYHEDACYDDSAVKRLPVSMATSPLYLYLRTLERPHLVKDYSMHGSNATQYETISLCQQIQNFRPPIEESATRESCHSTPCTNGPETQETCQTRETTTTYHLHSESDQ